MHLCALVFYAFSLLVKIGYCYEPWVSLRSSWDKLEKLKCSSETLWLV